MTESETIKSLADRWLEAKDEESKAAAKRVQLESAILALTGQKEEGSQTLVIDDYEIKSTGKLSYKVADTNALFNATLEWPEVIRPIALEMKVSETKLKRLRAEAPEYYKQIASLLEIKPQKTAVSITIKPGVSHGV